MTPLHPSLLFPTRPPANGLAAARANSAPANRGASNGASNGTSGLTSPATPIHSLAHNARGSFGETVLGRLLGAGPCFLEEKGSDVNLATQLLRDAHLRKMDCAVVISGDSDLLMPVRVVKNELGIPVGVLNPQKHPCAVLKQHATFYKHLIPGRIAKAQFPTTLADSAGAFSKPATWI